MRIFILLAALLLSACGWNPNEIEMTPAVFAKAQLWCEQHNGLQHVWIREYALGGDYEIQATCNNRVVITYHSNTYKGTEP